ncbi:hypothetical protein NRK67_00505 [Fusobacteria bacterium ZRK30]|nr:hypothetical protein NRK67_00505 [Fusobacteria bacterium ZRK30]
MARPESALSLELERSMNMQVRVETFEEHLRHGEIIDQLDDERRIKSFNLDKWNEDMQKSFAKTRKVILKLDDLTEIKEALKELDKKVNSFNKTYSKKIKQIRALELEYEKSDDELRIWLIEYATKCREKLRGENSGIEKKMMEENILKRFL